MAERTTDNRPIAANYQHLDKKEQSSQSQSRDIYAEHPATIYNIHPRRRSTRLGKFKLHLNFEHIKNQNQQLPYYIALYTELLSYQFEF